MARYTEARLMSLSKRKLVKLLKKEGIDANSSQKKSELVRLLILAHKANTPNRTQRISKRRTSRRFKIAMTVCILIVLTGGILYRVSPIFHENLNYIIDLAMGKDPVKNEESSSTPGDGPIIYEKAGKTYVVYDYPRPKVDVVMDEKCQRPECDLESYYTQIKESITPLAEFNEFDYRSRQGKSIIENFNVNLLPILVFDKTIEKTDNFEQSSRFFQAKNEKYILQLDPFKALKGPDLSNGQLLGETVDKKAPLTIVEYTSFSCPHCVEAYKNVETVLDTYEGNITLVIKYFSKGGNDMHAAVAAECAAQQGKFLEMHSLLFDEQNTWLPMGEIGLKKEFVGYAKRIDLDKNDFENCYTDNQEVIDLINTHTKEAESLAVDGLPTFFINNNIVQGSYPIESFTKIIDDILAEDGHTVQTKQDDLPETVNEETSIDDSTTEEQVETSADNESDLKTIPVAKESPSSEVVNEEAQTATEDVNKEAIEE